MIFFHREYIKERKGLISLHRKQDINVFNPAAAFSYHVQYEKLCHKNEIKYIIAQTTLPSCYLKVSSVLAGHNINLWALRSPIYFPMGSSTYLCTFLGCFLERTMFRYLSLISVSRLWMQSYLLNLSNSGKSHTATADYTIPSYINLMRIYNWGYNSQPALKILSQGCNILDFKIIHADFHRSKI